MARISDWGDARAPGRAPAPDRSSTLELVDAAAQEHRAFITVDHDASGGEGILAGVPFGVKDNIDTADLPTTGGTAALRSWQPLADAPAVAALRRAGAWVAGKTNLHELAFGVTSDNATYGAVSSPADTRRSAGGSSGGSAAAVAAGAVPFALGTDTGGSCTIPAAACGIVGYRPSPGRYDARGVIHLSHTRDVVGVLASVVSDVILVDTVLREETAPTGAPLGRERRLAVPAEHLEGLDPEVERIFRRALTRIRDDGWDIGDLSLRPTLDAAYAHGFSIVGYEAPRELERYLARGAGSACRIDLDGLARGARSPDVRRTLVGLRAEPVSVQEYALAIEERGSQRARLAAALAEGSIAAMIYPTLPAAPPLLGQDAVTLPGGSAAVFPALTRHTESGAFLGNASLTIPIARAGEMPTGLSIEVPYGHDDRLLAIAALLEGVVSADRSSGEDPDDR